MINIENNFMGCVDAKSENELFELTACPELASDASLLFKYEIAQPVECK